MPKSTISAVTPQAKFKDETSRVFLRHIATGNALVFAAYPGDEVLGCTGALLNHAKAGQGVRVIVLTDSAAESVKDRSAIREQARYAGQLIGVGDYETWGLAVAALEYGETLVRRLMDAIPEAGVANLYAPSVFETDPGRRALGLAAI
jgi:LmbE family N-acetylglucosaminyl deacetylase